MSKGVNRQGFLALLRTFVGQAVENNDKQWGRALATTLEKRAIQLRLAFGGATLLGSRRHGAGDDEAPEEDWDE